MALEEEGILHPGNLDGEAAFLRLVEIVGKAGHLRVDVIHAVEDEGFAARMILQVHDELDFECPENEVERLIAMVRAEMEGVVTLAVPLVADASVGTTWADAK